MTQPKIVRVGYGPYETKQELEEAESKAWLSLPIEERIKIMGLPEDFDPQTGVKK